MRYFLLASIASICLAQPAATGIWEEMAQKRAALGRLHQEFRVAQITRAGQAQTSEYRLQLDFKPDAWVERRVSPWGSEDRYFNGKEIITVDAGVGEYLRKKAGKDRKDMPAPYDPTQALWSKAEQTGTRPCGLNGIDRICPVFSVPLPRYSVLSNGKRISRLEGAGTAMFDPVTGILLAYRTMEALESEAANLRYGLETSYETTSLRYGDFGDARDFFAPVEFLREVKRFTEWDAKRLSKVLAGKPAPELAATGMDGKPVSLKGKTVLLDFWASWCPPCRSDAPALSKLHDKYGDRDLVIVGLDVGEDRSVVEEFVKKHKTEYTTVLTSENPLPRQYQVPAIPTYIVIGADGKLMSAAQGDQGFNDLKKMLKKAGLDVD